MMQWILDAGMLLITIAVLPQIYRTWKNRSNIKDIDFIFAFLAMIGNIFSMTWGAINALYSIALLNVTYFAWTLMSIIFMLKGRRDRKINV